MNVLGLISQLIGIETLRLTISLDWHIVFLFSKQQARNVNDQYAHLSSCYTPKYHQNRPQ